MLNPNKHCLEVLYMYEDPTVHIDINSKEAGNKTLSWLSCLMSINPEEFRRDISISYFHFILNKALSQDKPADKLQNSFLKFKNSRNPFHHLFVWTKCHDRDHSECDIFFQAEVRKHFKYILRSESLIYPK